MSPVFLPRLKGALYAVTAANNEKVRHLESNPRVSWIFQSKSLDKIATIPVRFRRYRRLLFHERLG
jgi:general stress protein 26